MSIKAERIDQQALFGLAELVRKRAAAIEEARRLKKEIKANPCDKFFLRQEININSSDGCRMSSKNIVLNDSLQAAFNQNLEWIIDRVCDSAVQLLDEQIADVGKALKESLISANAAEVSNGNNPHRLT